MHLNFELCLKLARIPKLELEVRVIIFVCVCETISFLFFFLQCLYSLQRDCEHLVPYSGAHLFHLTPVQGSYLLLTRAWSHFWGPLDLCSYESLFPGEIREKGHLV